MSLDQNSTPAPAAEAPAPPSVAAIENEFPTYRAISPHAVLALVAGLLSLFSVISPFFLAFAVLAVVMGFYADRRIQTYSDALTGRGLAQAGIGLGLVFGLGTVTMRVVQSQLRSAEAGAFAKQFVSTLKKGSLDEAVWYRQHPEARRGKSAEEVRSEVVKGMRDPHMFEMEYGTLKKLTERAATPGEDVHFVRIEESGAEDLSDYASALVEVHGPGSEKFPQKETHALLFLKSAQNEKTGQKEWWVEQMQYPYTPNTFVAPTKPVDPHGHGDHAH